ncbi:MAG: hypothetical protein AAFY72_06390 [Cyanobacteria bacterium J06649_4]
MVTGVEAIGAVKSEKRAIGHGQHLIGMFGLKNLALTKSKHQGMRRHR